MTIRYQATQRVGMLVLLGLCFSLSLPGQPQEELELPLEELDWQDLRTTGTLSGGTKVISGSRSEKAIEDLPFTIYVISGEEIRRNGYLTLTDALKRLPGIRVSQPGSALEGESFLMRGLQGNTYAKILINDIPIRPFLVSGMPIGAQLPIREAERIEVIYGPAATLYGADASAGVINIILKESERPVYVQSDMGFGMDGFENLDVMFGGKMGKNENVLTFKVFANYTSFDDRRIKYDQDYLYNPDTYLDVIGRNSAPYVNRSNYRGQEGAPILGELPHLSSALGLDLRFRNWQLSGFRLARQDHSSLGLSPYAVSYANPLNFFGERITSIQLNFARSDTPLRMKFGGGVLWYQTNERSSFSYVLPVVNLIQQPNPTVEMNIADSIRTAIDDRFFTNNRYAFAASFEANAQGLLSYTINDYLELAGGAEIQAGTGRPLLQFNRFPLMDISDPRANRFVSSEITTFVDLSTFLEAYLNFDRWNIILGGQFFSRQTDFLVRQQPVFNPRLAVQYRWTREFSLRASAGRSYRYPSPYYLATSYTVDRTDNPGFLQAGADLSPEETYSTEFGGRLRLKDRLSLDASLFYTRTPNYVSYGLRVNGNSGEVTLGYFNDQIAFVDLLGVQGSLSITDIISAIGLNATINVQYSRGREELTILSLSEMEEQTLTLDGVRANPDWIGQIDIEINPSNHIRVLLENTLISSSWPRNTILYQLPGQQPSDALKNPGFYTLDATVNYQFNKNLLAFLRMNNVFNQEYAGIDAATDADGLIYTPQSLRFLRFGINYRLD